MCIKIWILSPVLLMKRSQVLIRGRIRGHLHLFVHVVLIHVWRTSRNSWSCSHDCTRSRLNEFFFVQRSQKVAIWWQRVLDLLELHHVWVDGVLGWCNTSSGSKLLVLGWLCIYRVGWLSPDGINGIVDIIAHCDEKVIFRVPLMTSRICLNNQAIRFIIYTL